MTGYEAAPATFIVELADSAQVEVQATWFSVSDPSGALTLSMRGEPVVSFARGSSRAVWRADAQMTRAASNAPFPAQGQAAHPAALRSTLRAPLNPMSSAAGPAGEFSG